MDDSRQSENGRYDADLYRSIDTQWMLPQYQKQMRDNQAIKLMSAMSERDKAIQERNTALSEKRRAIAERDMAIVRRDAAVIERDAAIKERDNAIAALKFACENSINVHRHNAYIHNYQNHSVVPQSSNDNGSRQMLVTEPVEKAQKVKRKKKDASSEEEEPKTKLTKGNVSKLGIYVKPLNAKHHNEWKDQGIGLNNQVRFDESTMPAPVCSCTGKYRQCYKWGEGGWQSACCTTTLSMYPLPVMPNKKHGRIGGRKMSGTVFSKLLNKLAADGHDHSEAIDLKDHWAKHGTNRYITIR